MSSKVFLFGAKNCMLCEIAKEVAERVLPGYGLVYEYVNIRTDPELSERYGKRIPVFSYLGQDIIEGRIDDAGLSAALVQAGALPR